MRGEIEAVIRDLETTEDERGIEVTVADVEVGDGETFKVFDESGELSEELIGEKVRLSLMALVEDASRSGISGQAVSRAEHDPYYCLIGGRVVDRGLEEDGDNMLSLLTLDIGSGTVLVRFEDRHLYRKIRDGENLEILSNKIDLIEVLEG